MDEICHYYQEKKETKKEKTLFSFCDVKVIRNNEQLIIYCDFIFEYFKSTKKNKIRYYHELIIYKKNGDFRVIYKVENDTKTSCLAEKSKIFTRKNDFAKLNNLCINGIKNGEKNLKFWGEKYKKHLHNLTEIIRKELPFNNSSNYFSQKIYENDLYELIVDFHCFKKGIKTHNAIYHHIQEVYPKQKSLKLNKHKFLPAVLYEEGIKCNYFISELSNSNFHIKTLKFLCNLFGNNYIDYIKKIPWRDISLINIKQEKIYKYETEKEKKMFLNLLQDPKNLSYKEILISITDILKNIDFLKKRGLNVNLKIKSVDDLISQKELMVFLRRKSNLNHISYYTIPKKIVDEIEEPIIVNDKIFKPKVLIYEHDFVLEGLTMKNCIGRQFINGAICVFVSLRNFSRIINLEYNRGKLTQFFGKANSQVDLELFGEAIDLLSARMLKYGDLNWGKSKKLFTNIIFNEIK